MAIPDKTRNNQLLMLMFVIPWCDPVINTRPQATTNTTMVLIAVAKFEFIPVIPILARIDVSAAKNADKRANVNHIFLPPLNVSHAPPKMYLKNIN